MKRSNRKNVLTNSHLHFIQLGNTVKRSGDIFIILVLTENWLLRNILIRQYFCMDIMIPNIKLQMET